MTTYINIANCLLEDMLCLPRSVIIVGCRPSEQLPETLELLLEKLGDPLPEGELVAEVTKRVDRTGRYILTTRLVTGGEEGRVVAEDET